MSHEEQIRSQSSSLEAERPLGSCASRGQLTLCLLCDSVEEGIQGMRDALGRRAETCTGP